MNQLAIDIGNSYVKCGIFHKDTLLDSQTFQYGQWSEIQHFTQNKNIEKAVLCAVRDLPSADFKKLPLQGKILTLKHNLPLPITLQYQTPDTLGMDRLAAIVGAFYTYKGENVLVVDAGTCLTFDLLTSTGIYLGGAISPGRAMRLKAMHAFTAKLPEVLPDNQYHLMGQSTQEAMRNGAQTGLIAEVDHWVDSLRSALGSLKIIATGGDASYVCQYTRNSINEHPWLVLFGSIKILEYNVQK
jgi:type III pantothenate kinase